MIRVLVFVFLLVTAYFGLSNGPADLLHVESAGQLVVSLAVTAYGVAGLVGAYGLWRRKPWTRLCIAVWALGTTTAAAVAPRAYGDATVSVWAVLVGTLAAAALAGGVLWFVIRDLGRPSTP
jgi:hypothetical protein